MRRIASMNNRDYTHPEANKWLRDFMVDLKKMVLIEENYQPFTIERLNEWTEKHHRDIASCANWESSMIKRLSDELIPEHQNALMVFNALVIDLKLMVKNHPHREITEERINEADKAYSQVHDCRKRRLIYY